MVSAIRKHKISTLVLIDLVCIIVGLNVFALFHHVLDFSKTAEPVALPSSAAAEPVRTEAPALTPAVTEETAFPEESAPVDEPVRGRWGKKFADHFIEGDPVVTDSSYQSENIHVVVNHVEENGLIYNVADIYLRDLEYLRSGLGGDGFRAATEQIGDMSARLDAVVAISGDHYGARQEGPVVRNGLLYRETPFEDVCILTNEGEMITCSADEFDIESVKETGAWQIWSFGPALLDDGRPKTEFVSSVTRANPRSAIGCVEPGHYVFVQVDGRIDASRGMTMEELSQLFASLGCTAAYNLDGGQSAGFTFMGKLWSYPYRRAVWDIIYIGET